MSGSSWEGAEPSGCTSLEIYLQGRSGISWDMTMCSVISPLYLWDLGRVACGCQRWELSSLGHAPMNTSHIFCDEKGARFEMGWTCIYDPSLVASMCNSEIKWNRRDISYWMHLVMEASWPKRFGSVHQRSFNKWRQRASDLKVACQGYIEWGWK